MQWAHDILEANEVAQPEQKNPMPCKEDPDAPILFSPEQIVALSKEQREKMFPDQDLEFAETIYKMSRYLVKK